MDKNKSGAGSSSPRDHRATASAGLHRHLAPALCAGSAMAAFMLTGVLAAIVQRTQGLEQARGHAGARW